MRITIDKGVLLDNDRVVDLFDWQRIVTFREGEFIYQLTYLTNGASVLRKFPLAVGGDTDHIRYN